MGQLENFRLKVFRAVAEHLNFHDAAEHLFLTQPAVTLQIKALENDLGCGSLIVPVAESRSRVKVQCCLAMPTNLLSSSPKLSGSWEGATAGSQENCRSEFPRPLHNTFFHNYSEPSWGESRYPIIPSQREYQSGRAASAGRKDPYWPDQGSLTRERRTCGTVYGTRVGSHHTTEFRI